MPLAPDLASHLEAIRPSTTIALDEDGAEIARRLRERQVAAPLDSAFDDVRSEDHVLDAPDGEISVRLYRPPGPAPDPAPVIVHLHGGGWVLGGVAFEENRCRALAAETGAAVASVAYRLAPEHPFPTPLDDAYAATAWVTANAARLGLDPQRVAVMGSSAGGNLAAAVTLLARERGGPALAFQALIYPVCDASGDHPSHRQCSDVFPLTAEEMRWFWRQYVPDADTRLTALASPLRATDLSGLPPAYVLTAEFDPLRDEGEAYAARLAAAGVPIVHERAKGMVHGFLAVAPHLPQVQALFAGLARQLKRGLE